MANVSVRNLDDGVHDALRRRAARAGHSMESEIRRILTDATRDDPPTDPFLRLMHRARAAGGVELEPPARDFGPPIDFADEAFG